MLRKAIGLAALGAIAIALPARADDLPSPLTRDAVLRHAVEHHPSVLAARARSEATDKQADGEGKLPSPELGLDIWQVPLKRPYAIDQAGMFMVSLRQRFPSIGSLGAQQDMLWKRYEERLAAAGADRDAPMSAAAGDGSCGHGH